ncbi:hypothetical protein [Nocardioides sp.]|uniref:hypothetical protein n=1 Tax=Nocardioides sp. TaxID=35761 RepID=UPI0027357BB4|nr:hypothetical protein [Nocardioides sp.]MDP3891287.1 hypothetical protein [Nocardioides sp.]
MNPALGLAAARVLIGGVALVSPHVGARLFRLDPETNPQLPYMTRLFGSREIAIGAATLLTTGTMQRNLIATGVAIDAADAVAAVLAGATGGVSRPTGVMLTLPALAAAAAGIAGLPRAR